MTPREWQKARTRIWRAGAGCDCPATVGGKLVLKADRCSPTWVRCNGRLRVIHEEYAKLGPCPECGRATPITHDPGCKRTRAIADKIVADLPGR